MNKILLKSVVLLVPGEKAKQKDVLVEGNRFAKIADSITPSQFENARVVDCLGKAILPPFYNSHTHAAMTLLRGYADDLPLQPWLEKFIWPFEAKMGPAEIEIGSRLAALEMIKSGTVFFNDMYWHREYTIKVVNEMGLRAAIGTTMAENLVTPEKLEANFKFIHDRCGVNDRIQLVMMPHSIYLAGEALLKRCAKFAEEENVFLHTHLSETRFEVDNCMREHQCSPVEWLEKCGALSPRLSAAHCVHLSDHDMELMSSAGVTAVLNPCSNLKLNSGIPNIPAMLKSGVKLALGTDGASSNNNLDMGEEMKAAALIAKVIGSAETLPAGEALRMATRAGAEAFGIDAGAIEEGKLADCILVDLKNERMVPCHDLISNWVYAADSSCIDSVMCNGKFLMENRHVDGEEDILKEAEACAKRLAAL